MWVQAFVVHILVYKFCFKFRFPYMFDDGNRENSFAFYSFFFDGFFFCVWRGITYCELMAKEFLLSRFSPCDQRVIAFGNFSI